MRAMHTVLDAAVFLLFVGAAVGTLALPVAQPTPGAADAATAVVTTATAQVDYSLAPGARHADESLVAFPTESGPAFERTAHGTLAEHLAAAAMRNVTVGGEQLTRTGDGFERASVAAVRNATRGGRPVAVRAVWTPHPGSRLRGEVRAGPRPPPTADVWAVTVAVDSGVPAARERALAAARTAGYDGVARVVAAAVVRGLFPPDRSRLALVGDYPVDALVAYRYRRFARLTGADVGDAVDAAAPRRANERLARALAPRVERDLRARYDSPAAAARAVDLDAVRVTVRVWSP